MRLVDAEAIIEVMKKCAENPENAQALLCYRYAQRILEEAPTVEPASPWHRVEEELPNVDEKVLVFAVGKLDGFIGDTVIALTSMSDTNWLNHHEKVDEPYWLDPWQYFLTDYRITHWMPLPEPPKEDA